MHSSPRYFIGGEYFYEIVDEKTNRVESSSVKCKNLILNQGFAFLTLRSYVENVAYCAIGIGTSPPLQTDTSLASESARTNVLDTSYPNYAQSTLVYPNNNASTAWGAIKSGPYVSWTRVFKFAGIDPYALYGELGWSYDSVAGNNLFSKTTFPSPISVPRGKYLRIHYTLTLAPHDTPTVYNANYGERASIYPPALGGVVDGIASSFSLAYSTWGNGYGNFNVGLKSLNADGSLGYFDGSLDSNEPYSTVSFFMSSDAYVAGSGSRAATQHTVASEYIANVSGIYVGANTYYTYTKAATLTKTATGYLGSFGYGPTGGAGVTGSAVANPGFCFIALTGLNGRDAWGVDLPGIWNLPYVVSYDGTYITGYSFKKDTEHTLTFAVQLGIARF